MTTATARVEALPAPRTRRFVMGILYLLMGLVLWFGFALNVSPGDTTSFGLTPGGVETTVGEWTFQTQPALTVLALVCVFVGGVELVRGLGRLRNWALAFVVVLFVSWVYPY